MQFFGELRGRWFCPRILASRPTSQVGPASLDTTIIIGLAPIEDFESIAVNYN